MTLSDRSEAVEALKAADPAFARFVRHNVHPHKQSGYAIVDVDSRDEAVALGRQFMEIHAAVMGASYEGECEIREMFDGANCGAHS